MKNPHVLILANALDRFDINLLVLDCGVEVHGMYSPA